MEKDLMQQDSLASKIKFARELRQMTRAELAKKMHMGQADVERLETGQFKDPGFAFICQVADVLDISVLALAELDYEDFKNHLVPKTKSNVTFTPSAAPAQHHEPVQPKKIVPPPPDPRIEHFEIINYLVKDLYTKQQWRRLADKWLKKRGGAPHSQVYPIALFCMLMSIASLIGLAMQGMIAFAFAAACVFFVLGQINLRRKVKQSRAKHNKLITKLPHPDVYTTGEMINYQSYTETSFQSIKNSIRSSVKDEKVRKDLLMYFQNLENTYLDYENADRLESSKDFFLIPSQVKELLEQHSPQKTLQQTP